MFAAMPATYGCALHDVLTLGMLLAMLSAISTSILLGPLAYAVVVLSAWHSDSICWTVKSAAVFYLGVMPYSEKNAEKHICLWHACSACMYLVIQL